jgi:hypothetical protein
VLFKVEENPVSRRLKKIVAFVVRNDTKLLIAGNHTKIKTIALQIINLLLQDKKKLHCTYCNEDGHTTDRCFRKNRNEKKDDKQDDANLIMIAIDGSKGQNFHRNKTSIER